MFVLRCWLAGRAAGGNNVVIGEPWHPGSSRSSTTSTRRMDRRRHPIDGRLTTVANEAAAAGECGPPES